MSDQPDGTTPTPTQTPATSGAPSTVDGKTAEQWAASYKGLQSAYQKLQETTKKEISDLSTEVHGLRTQLEEANQGSIGKDSQVAVLNKKIADLESQLAAAQAAAENEKKAVGRTRLIMSEFSDLAPFEAQGLLPVGETEEDTRAKLAVFRETLGGLVGGNTKKTLAGATPPTPGANPAPGTTKDGESVEYVWDQMMQHAGRNDVEFAKWQKKYDELTSR